MAFLRDCKYRSLLGVSGIYLTIVMALTSVSVILTVFVLNLHYRGPDDTPVPRWIRKLFLPTGVKRGFTFKQNSPFVDEYLSDANARFVKNVSLRMTIEDLAQELHEELEDSTDAETELTRRQLHIHARAARTNEDILSALKKIIDRYERDDHDEALMYEWQQVAVAVDRILFWVFFTATLSSTVIVLIIAPLTKYIELD